MLLSTFALQKYPFDGFIFIKRVIFKIRSVVGLGYMMNFSFDGIIKESPLIICMFSNKNIQSDVEMFIYVHMFMYIHEKPTKIICFNM